MVKLTYKVVFNSAKLKLILKVPTLNRFSNGFLYRTPSFFGFEEIGPETLQTPLTLIYFQTIPLLSFGPIWPEMYLEVVSRDLFY